MKGYIYSVFANSNILNFIVFVSDKITKTFLIKNRKYNIFYVIIAIHTMKNDKSKKATDKIRMDSNRSILSFGLIELERKINTYVVNIF